MGRFARFWGIAVATMMPVVLIAGAAGAIVGGEVDEGHPNVGFVVELDGTTVVDGCTGTLISESVVLTAKHCLADELDYAVSFEPTVDISSHEGFIEVSGYATNAALDVALLYLAQPATGIMPAELPEEGALGGYRKGDAFTHVGYGLDRAPTRRQSSTAVTEFTRRKLTASLSKLSATQLFTRTPDGALCNGDSGGPVFDGRVIVGLGNYVSGNCKGVNSGPRLDTEPVRSFLSRNGVPPS